jgi:hypothetical protein
MSPNRKPTTAEARQELDAILSALDERAPGISASEKSEQTEPEAAAGTEPQTEGQAPADTEPKAEP